MMTNTFFKLMMAGTLLTSFSSGQAENTEAPAVVTMTENEIQAAEQKTQKLVHVKSNFTLVEFIGEDTVFHDRVLEKEMVERGVLIPPALRGLYNGKEAIRLGEQEFQRAFKEIFSINIFDSSNYAWEE